MLILLFLSLWLPSGMLQRYASVAVTPDDYGDSLAVLTAKQMLVTHMVALELRHGIHFRTGWSPSVKFMVPDDLDSTRQNAFGAHYDLATESFYFNPEFERDFIRCRTMPESTADLARLLYHELGHAYADQFSQSRGLGQWPNLTTFRALSETEQLGVIMASEGIAEWLWHSMKFNDSAIVFQLVQLPERQTMDMPYVMWEWLAYTVGLELVRPFLDRDLIAGILYVETHPLRISKNGNIRKAFRTYQRKGLKK
jgi:hypothetical protein